MAQTARTPITKEVATAVLTKLAKNVITVVGTPIKGIEIQSISFTRTNDQGLDVPFTHASGDEYAVVNLRAVNKHQLEQAVLDYQAGNYNEACNRNMSLQMSVADANLLGKKSFGTLTCQHVALKNKDTGIPTGEIAIMPYSFVPAVAIAAVAVDFMAMLNASVPVEIEVEA